MRGNTILNIRCKFIFCSMNLFLNGLFIRYINLNLIGIANIRLELFCRTILYGLRESPRRNIPTINNMHSIYHYINLM